MTKRDDEERFDELDDDAELTLMTTTTDDDGRCDGDGRSGGQANKAERIKNRMSDSVNYRLGGLISSTHKTIEHDAP